MRSYTVLCLHIKSLKNKYYICFSLQKLMLFIVVTRKKLHFAINQKKNHRNVHRKMRGATWALGLDAPHHLGNLIKNSICLLGAVWTLGRGHSLFALNLQGRPKPGGPFRPLTPVSLKVHEGALSSITRDNLHSSCLPQGRPPTTQPTQRHKKARNRILN